MTLTDRGPSRPLGLADGLRGPAELAGFGVPTRAFRVCASKELAWSVAAQIFEALRAHEFPECKVGKDHLALLVQDRYRHGHRIEADRPLLDGARLSELGECLGPAEPVRWGGGRIFFHAHGILHQQEGAGKHFSPGGCGSILPAGRDPVTKPDLLTQILGFLSTIARFIGSVIVQLVQYILPSVKDLTTLAEPIGYLALLTLFVILTSAARRVALIILLAGWALIFIRILLMAFRIG